VRLTASEEKGDAPKTCKGNYGVNNTGNDCLLTATDPCYKVETEKTDASPVQCADDGEQKGYSVKYHIKYNLSE